MIPNKIKVSGIEYDVAEVEGIHERFSTLGQIHYHKGIIELDSQLSQTRKEQVFVHELLHACFFEAGYEEQDEDVINRVGIVLYQILKENQFDFNKD
jgi:IrrE N-terminal-like domain